MIFTDSACRSGVERRRLLTCAGPEKPAFGSLGTRGVFGLGDLCGMHGIRRRAAGNCALLCHRAFFRIMSGLLRRPGSILPHGGAGSGINRHSTWAIDLKNNSNRPSGRGTKRRSPGCMTAAMKGCDWWRGAFPTGRTGWTKFSMSPGVGRTSSAGPMTRPAPSSCGWRALCRTCTGSIVASHPRRPGTVRMSVYRLKARKRLLRRRSF